MFQWLTGGILKGVGGIMNAGKGIYTAIAGDKGAQQAASAAEQMAILQGYQAEFLAPEKHNWFNVLVDGANRLVRPMYTYGMIAMFAWAGIDPVSFVLFAQGLAVVPEMMWAILLTITGFWFGGRLFEKYSGGKTMIVDPALAEKIANNRESIAAAIQDKKRAEKEMLSDDDFDKLMADTSKPLSNAAILEWNARRKAKGKSVI